MWCQNENNTKVHSLVLKYCNIVFYFNKLPFSLRMVTRLWLWFENEYKAANKQNVLHTKPNTTIELFFCFLNVGHVMFPKGFAFCLFINYAYISTRIRQNFKETALQGITNITWPTLGKQNVQAKKRLLLNIAFERAEKIILQGHNRSLIYSCSLVQACWRIETGDYVYSFYMTGGSLLVAFLIPMVLEVIKCKQSRVHPQNIEEGDKKEATRRESEA